MTRLADLVPLEPLLPLNVGVTNASEETMISALGRPQLPLTWSDQPDRASPAVKKLLVDDSIGKVRVSGVKPAVESLKQILSAAFTDTPAIETSLTSAGMLAVRYRKPTSGIVSYKISNHAWGTAVDFALVGEEAPGKTGDQIPYFIALLLPHFLAAGWYSGIAFHDDMHFEIADETIKAWAVAGKFAT